MTTPAPREAVHLDACLVGAQKCGTTSLAAWLDLHPQVCHSTEKEPFFWDVDRSAPEVDGYFRTLFPHHQTGQLRIEASTTYAMHPQITGVPARLHEHNPSMRILYMVRDPVDRVESHLVHRYLKGRIDEPSVRDVLTDPIYLDRSRYGLQLTQYLEVFARNAIHIVVLEELLAQPERVLGDVERFLGIEVLDPCPPVPALQSLTHGRGVSTPERVLARAGVHLPDRLTSRVRRVVGRTRPGRVLSLADREEVREALSADTAGFREILGRDPGW